MLLQSPAYKRTCAKAYSQKVGTLNITAVIADFGIQRKNVVENGAIFWLEISNEIKYTKTFPKII